MSLNQPACGHVCWGRSASQSTASNASSVLIERKKFSEYLLCLWVLLMLLPPIFIKIQHSFAFLVPTYPDCPGKEAINYSGFGWVFNRESWGIIEAYCLQASGLPVI